MAEENKVQQDPSIVTEQKTVNVLDANGNDLVHKDSPLADIFNKIEAGSKAEDAIKEVMDKPEKKVEEKKVEQKVEEKKEEKKEVVEDKKVENKKDGDDFFETKDERKASEDAKKAEQEKKAADERAKEEEVTEEELQVLPHDKPKTAKRIKTLWDKAEKAMSQVAETKKEVEEKNAKLAALEAELNKIKTTDPLQNEEVKKQLDDLKMYRRRYELEKDPEVKEKFDLRVESAETSIKQTLAKRGAGAALIKIIEDEGGWLKFADSDRDIELANGQTMKAAEIADAIKKTLPASERRSVDALELEQIQTRRERERFFAEETKKASAYFEQHEQASKQQQELQKQAVEQSRKLIDEWRVKVEQENEWLKEKEIPAAATQDQRAAVEEENKHTKQVRGVIMKALNASKLDDMLEVVLDSAKYYQERRTTAKLGDRVKTLEAQLAEKQAEIDKFKKAGASIPKSGSLVGGGGSPAQTKKAATPEGLEAAFEQLASGKSLTGEE